MRLCPGEPTSTLIIIAPLTIIDASTEATTEGIVENIIETTTLILIAHFTSNVISHITQPTVQKATPTPRNSVL